MRRWLVLILFTLLLSPLVAVGDTEPQLLSGVAGPDGAIRQYTMKFSEAMVPLGDPRAQAPATLTCPVPSEGHWVDTQTYIYAFPRPLPGGLRCTVKLRDDLKTARGAPLGGERVGIIDTGGPIARAVLGGTVFNIDEDQVFLIAPNMAPRAGAVAAGVYCAVEGIGEKIPVDILPSETVVKLVHDTGWSKYRVRSFLESAGAGEDSPKGFKVDEAALKNLIGVRCHRPLPPGHEMSLVWGKDIAAANGMTAGRDQRFDFRVRKAFEARFECSRTNPKAGCNPVESAYLRLSTDVSIAQAQQARLTFADGTLLKPVISKDDARKGLTSELEFKGLPLAAANPVLSLPADLADDSGRKLANGARFPLTVHIDEPPPLIKFAAPFGIVEAKEGGIMPVTVRGVEPQLAPTVHNVAGAALRVEDSDGEVAQWLRDVATHEESEIDYGDSEKNEPNVNHTGEKSLLAGKGAKLSVPLANAGKAFEVIGVPLKTPGFYVVELASPKLGQALLGRNAPRYVAASALVTNMAVHFKWGRERSLAWVTALDSAHVVGGAEVRVTDSCDGAIRARGTTDSEGRLLVTGLPEPTSYTGCDGEATHPLMVSARKSGDFSFTLTSWNKGIEPYNFELSSGRTDTDDIIHTVFDRALIRAGETVNMKHILRHPGINGFSLARGFSGTLVLENSAADTKFELPVKIGPDGIGESQWTAPKGAAQGEYSLNFKIDGTSNTLSSGQSVRVDEFRIPTMRASVAGPKQALVRPKSVLLDLFVGFFSGGGAASAPVSIRTSYRGSSETPDGWDGWTFGGQAPVAGTLPLDEDGGEDTPKTLPGSSTLPLTLGNDGTGHSSIDIGKPIDDVTVMQVEMDYQDANGETLTAARDITLYPSAVQIGLKTDGWLMRDTDLRLKLVTLGLDGKLKAGQTVKVDVFTREILTTRRRLIGGFYAYDSVAKVTAVGGGCGAITDAQGLASCKLSPGVSGEVYVVATTTDADGNVARAVKTVWLAGEDEWWFGGDNGDRMDVVPEQKAYKSGDTARFQVRMPFRSATALVTVEREGVMSSFVTELSGKDPVVSVKLPAAYAPNVYVSVMAVRGRVGGWSSWLADLAHWLHLPFFQSETKEPTALIDMAKPSYRMGIAKINVGWEGHMLGVKVKTDKTRYGVRETAHVDIAVTAPGAMPAGAEIAFVAVDEALLALRPNDSTDVLTAMMGQRGIEVFTSTGQMQVVGKRHYGRKAVAAGGGGGGDQSGVTRDDFRPMLLWKGRVKLDSAGHAKLDVPLADSLSSYKLVAIATAGADLFGSGSATIRTAQDLSIYAGIPPLVRSGDTYGASFTLHNGSDRNMTVQATMAVTPAVVTGAPLSVTIPAGGAAPVTWNVHAPDGVSALNWHIEAHEVNGKALDKLSVTEVVIPAVPVEIWAAQLMRGGGASTPLLAPQGAVPGYGFVDVKLSDTLSPPLGSVRDYMTAYPYNCFEQRLSRIVATNDSAGWTRLAAEIPAYLDGDGLLRYFPDNRLHGSDSLTAYTLSIAADAGLAIPETSRAKMITALQAIASGKLKHDYAWNADGRLLKVAALGALARQGAATPALVAGAYVAPQETPTSILVDWLVALNATKAHPEWKAAAEHVLRGRLVYAGSRVDLTDGANEPWYIMSSYDEAAIKVLGYALARPDWKDDVPKLMVGVALRQQRGHWDTTPANAWGVLAAEHFNRQYPASAITGMTKVALGAASATRNWPQAKDAPLLRLPLPLVTTPLIIAQSGGQAPWALVSVNAAVPLKTPLFSGYRISRTVTPVLQSTKGQWSRGDVMRVRITIEASAGRTWVVVNDPVPPGATILNGLGGQSAQLNSTRDDASGPSYVDRGNDVWRGYYEWMPTGTVISEYTLRLNGTGRFQLPPTRVEAMYSPDIRGQLPNAPIEVMMK
jgi:uncharacterized protein YfaS (alpha-2-macroglobulin family)